MARKRKNNPPSPVTTTKNTISHNFFVDRECKRLQSDFESKCIKASVEIIPSSEKSQYDNADMLITIGSKEYLYKCYASTPRPNGYTWNSEQAQYHFGSYDGISVCVVDSHTTLNTVHTYRMPGTELSKWFNKIYSNQTVHFQLPATSKTIKTPAEHPIFEYLDSFDITTQLHRKYLSELEDSQLNLVSTSAYIHNLIISQPVTPTII